MTSQAIATHAMRREISNTERRFGSVAVELLLAPKDPNLDQKLSITFCAVDQLAELLVSTAELLSKVAEKSPNQVANRTKSFRLQSSESADHVNIRLKLSIEATVVMNPYLVRRVFNDLCMSIFDHVQGHLLDRVCLVAQNEIDAIVDAEIMAESSERVLAVSE